MLNFDNASRESAYAEIESRVKRFKALSKRERDNYNEAQTRHAFILPLFQALGWDISDPAQVSPEEKVSRGWVDFAFIINGKPRLFLETKKIAEPLTKPEYIKQARDYAWNKGVTWAVLSDFEGLRVFNAEWKEADPLQAQFLEFSVDTYLSDFDRLWWLSRPEVEAGRLDREAERLFKKTPRTPITESLFGHLVKARQDLYKNFRAYNKNLLTQPRAIDDAVQRMLDRLIFVRTAEDRDVEPESLRALIRETPHSKIPSELYRRFRELDGVYNSQLFASHFTDGLDCEAETIRQVVEGLYYSQANQAEYNFAAIDADVLGRVYEQYLGYVFSTHEELESKKTKRKAQGIYYTPTFVVDYIVRETLGQYLEEHGYNPSKPLRVLDPACGSGSFLIQAFDVLDRYLARQEGSEEGTYTTQDAMRQRRILEQNLYGVDKDEQAVEVARLNLMLKALHQRDKLPMLKHIAHGDSLISGTDEELEKYFGPEWRSKSAFNWEERFPEAMKEDGFDVIIGNPPYVRIQTLPKDEVGFYNDFYDAATGNYDLYVLFVERALRLLKPGGVFGMILPKKFMQTAYGAGLRELLSEQKAVSKIVDFGDAQVFEGATTYTCLLFLQKTVSARLQYVSAGDWLNAQEISPQTLPHNLPVSEFSASSISADPWHFSIGVGADLIERLLAMPAKLGDIADIFVGLQTSADDVFILDLVEARGKTPVLRSKSLRATRSLETELLHPLMSGTDVARYGNLALRQFILFPYLVRDHRAELIPFDKIERRYPLTATYLKENRRRLESRENGKFEDKMWYRFGRNQNLGVQSRVKLCVPRLVEKLCATLDSDGIYFLDNVDVGGVTLKDEFERHGLLYILGLLNSKLLGWLFPYVSVPFHGGWWSANRQFLSKIPIRLIDFSNSADKRRHTHIVAMVERMLKLHKELGETTALYAEKQGVIQERIDRLDEEIDTAVYELYGLTEQEKEIVEETSKSEKGVHRTR